jgi:hypothetical protein
MPASAAKRPGDRVRLLRGAGEDAAIEDDWLLIRFEPDSGNLVAEKDGKRITRPRDEYEKLNFPGSDDIWEILSGNDEEDLNKAKSAWAGLDLAKTSSGLLGYGRTLDSAFAGCQTAADFQAKVRSLADSCASAVNLLRIELKRAEAEYDRCPTGTSFENDRKDHLLSRLRDVQERYSTRLYGRDTLLPAWRRVADCLESLKAAQENR